MSKPPDPIVRKTLGLPSSMWRDVAAYQATERIATESEAIRRLLQTGLRLEKKKEKV